jgi:putative membrane protein
MTHTRHSLTLLAGSIGLAIATAVTAQTTAPGSSSGTPATTRGPAAAAPPSGSNSPAAAGQNAPGNSMAKDGAASLSSSDRSFMKKAAEGGMAEVELGQLAAQRASDPQVKQFAQRMVADHTKANGELKQIAAKKNVELPTELPASVKRERDKLSKLTGAQFDKEYMSHMTSDHKKDTSLFRSTAKSGKDTDVRQFASTTLPTLEEHLQMAQSIDKSMKAAGRSTAKSSS